MGLPRAVVEDARGETFLYPGASAEGVCGPA